MYYYETTITGDVTNTALVTANPVLAGGADLPGIVDVTDTDSASVDAFVIPTTTVTTTSTTSTTSTTIQVCSCSGASPFLAGNKASLGTGTFVAGNLGVNTALGLLQLAPFSEMANATTVYADRVKLGDAASVFDLRTNDLSVAPTTKIRGEYAGLGSLPLTDPFCPFVEPPRCGSGDLDVNNGAGGQIQELRPREYGELRIGAGSRVRLTGVGRFGFCSLTLWEDATLVADQQVVIDVVGSLSLGSRATITTASGMPLVLNVGGSKFRVGSDGRIDAAITAPKARMKLKPYASVNGCLCAGLLKTAANADLTCIGD